MFKQFRSAPGGPAPYLRAVCWILVAFYLVASCRAFLPGICATLNTMYAAQADAECEVLTSGRSSCCAGRTAPDTDENGAPNRPPATPQDGHCPFCTLVTSLCPAPCAVTLPAPSAPIFAAAIPLQSLTLQSYVPRALQDRAPPA